VVSTREAPAVEQIVVVKAQEGEAEGEEVVAKEGDLL